MTRRIALALALGALALTGCHASAKDACQALADCGKKLDPNKPAPSSADIDKCATDLDKSTDCGDQKQEAIDCLADMKCENQTSAVGELFGCLGKCPGAK